MTTSIRHSCLALLGCVLVATSAGAADPTPMTAHLVKTGLYLIEGGGANTLMRFSAAGLIVVDGKAPGTYRDLMSQIRQLNKISDLPLQVLILTSGDESKTGNLDRFTASKVPIVADESTKRALEGRVEGPAPRFVTFADKYTIRMGGVEVDILHVSSGDTVVYFPNLKVVAIGDLGEASAGSRSAGDRAAALSEVLALDFDTAIPSHGSALSRQQVAALKAAAGPDKSATAGK